MGDNCCEHCEKCTKALVQIGMLLVDIKAVLKQEAESNRILRLIEGKHTATHS
jgi:hypothetical protein